MSIRDVQYSNSNQAIGQITQHAAGYQQQAVQPDIPVLEAQVNRLTQSAQDIDQLAVRLHQLADRLFGVIGNEGKAGAPVPSPSHAIGKLNEAHEWLESARNNLGAAVSRLEAL